MSQPWIIGESNPYGANPYYALYPEPRGCSGWRLCHLVLGMGRDEYMEAFSRRNLLAGSRWSAPRAREAAASLAAEIGDLAPVILLGRRVAAAFRLDAHEPFSLVSNGRRSVVLLPHPSGLCRLWHEPGAYERARELVARVRRAA